MGDLLVTHLHSPFLLLGPLCDQVVRESKDPTPLLNDCVPHPVPTIPKLEDDVKFRFHLVSPP